MRNSDGPDPSLPIKYDIGQTIKYQTVAVQPLQIESFVHILLGYRPLLRTLSSRNDPDRSEGNEESLFCLNCLRREIPREVYSERSKRASCSEGRGKMVHPRLVSDVLDAPGAPPSHV